MKRIMALTALVSVVALFAFTSQATAQDEPSLTADPATVAAEGEHSFTVSGAGFTPGLALFVLPCTIPGDPLTPASTPAEIGAGLAAVDATGGDCILDSLTLMPVTAGDDGTFSVQRSANVGQNFAWAAGDVAQTEVGSALIFIVDPMDDGMIPEGGADTGFGGMAGNGSSLVVPLAAGLFAVVMLGGAAITLRRND